MIKCNTLVVTNNNEINGTQGQFQSYLIDLELKQNGQIYKDISFPFDISLISTQWITNVNQIGDTVEFQISPDTIVGNITSNIGIGTNIIQVSDNVFNTIKIGYYVSINDENLGRVIFIDKFNKTITTEINTTIKHQNESIIKTTIKLIPYFRFTTPGSYIIGENQLCSTFIPSNSILRIILIIIF